MARTFGATWWGTAWLDALESKALTDAGRLSRGRTYARQGRVDDLELQPGLVSSHVEGGDEYTAQLGVRRLSEDAWDRLISLIVERAAYTAALLTGELPETLNESAEEIGVAILPGSGDLVPDCTCPDWGEPCKHVAAMCYLLTDLIDADPFVLLMLRGRGRDELLTELRRRRSGSAAVEVSDQPRGADPGVPAVAAYRQALGDLPRSRPVPRAAGRPARLGTPPPADSGVRAADLSHLVADAAVRAARMLAGEGTSALELDHEADIARLAATALASQAPTRRRRPPTTAATVTLAALADALDRSIDELEARAVAWQFGGNAGLVITDDTWTPDPAQMAVGEAVLSGKTRVSGNRVTAGTRQLRLGTDGRWWPFVADDRLGWVLAGVGFADPGDALADAELRSTTSDR